MKSKILFLKKNLFRFYFVQEFFDIQQVVWDFMDEENFSNALEHDEVKWCELTRCKYREKEFELVA